MTYRDEFDEPPRGSGFLGHIGPKAAFFAVLIALSFMIGVVWKLYVGANENTNKGVPIVRADADPFKVTPEDPGGMEIAHKDSTIFSSLKGGDEDSRVENLLAEDNSEEPMPRSQLFAGLNTEKSPDLDAEAQPTPLDKPASKEAQQVAEEQPEPEKTEEVEQEVAAAIPEKVEPVVEEQPEPVKEPDPEPIVKIEPKPEPKPEPEPEPKVEPASGTPKAEPVKQASPSSGSYYVQLASITDKSRAESEWNKLNKKYASQLSGYAYRIETATLDKGTFHRIQAGPVSKDQAIATCEAIKRVSPGGCLVKKQ